MVSSFCVETCKLRTKAKGGDARVREGFWSFVETEMAGMAEEVAGPLSSSATEV
jgi:hypothetical protein